MVFLGQGSDPVVPHWELLFFLFFFLAALPACGGPGLGTESDEQLLTHTAATATPYSTAPGPGN